jgi:LPXTG-motif cell wall-anchored protein
VDTSVSNTFTFKDVPDGNYSVVATDGVYSKTKRVLIKNGTIIYPDQAIDLVLSGKNTSVVITTDNTPNITADNLDSVFYDETNYTDEDVALVEGGNGTVEFRLYATLMRVSDVTSEEISAMYSAASNREKLVGAYLDLSLFKIVTDADGNVTKTRVTELGGGSNISITIPLGDLANKSGLEVIRVHDTGERFIGAYLADQDNNPSTYTIVSSQYSTYAILYDPEKEPVTTEEIKDGTLDPSDDGKINITTEDTGKTPGEDDPSTEDLGGDDPADDNPGDDGKDKKPASGGSSVGSLRSSGSAKTGDATPIVMLFGMMVVSMAGFVVLRKKARD